MTSWHSYPKIWNLGHSALKEALYNWAINNILRISTSGLPDWYKKELVNLQFEDKK